MDVVDAIASAGKAQTKPAREDRQLRKGPIEPAEPEGRSSERRASARTAPGSPR